MKDLVDIQTLHPGAVTTNLNNFMEHPSAVTPDACARGSLCDLGRNSMSIFGALMHSALGGLNIPIINKSPDLMKIVGHNETNNPHTVI